MVSTVIFNNLGLSVFLPSLVAFIILVLAPKYLKMSVTCLMSSLLRVLPSVAVDSDRLCTIRLSCLFSLSLFKAVTTVLAISGGGLVEMVVGELNISRHFNSCRLSTSLNSFSFVSNKDSWFSSLFCLSDRLSSFRFSLGGIFLLLSKSFKASFKFGAQFQQKNTILVLHFCGMAHSSSFNFVHLL